MDTRLAERALAALLFVTAAAPIAAQQVATPPGMDLSASFVSYDGGTSRVEFRGLKLSQNDVSIAADSATADTLDFKRSTWTLRGDVRISVATAQISSDEAVLTVRNNKFATIEVRGDPARFEESASARGEKVEGHANRLFFDGAKRTLNLTGDAWLKMGANEIRSCDLIFDLNAQTFSSGATDCGENGVRITTGQPQQSRETSERAAPGNAERSK
ncbi:MAG TPA: LptA/OstA family protein [Gammaproteobacteria bacterium]|nr:LptA/OstA family protein [Gammaproteobacteria bacterium]